jgi:hypothetical protein
MSEDSELAGDSTGSTRMDGRSKLGVAGSVDDVTDATGGTRRHDPVESIVVLPVARTDGTPALDRLEPLDWTSLPGCVGVLADSAGIHLDASVDYLVFPWNADAFAYAAQATLVARGVPVRDVRQVRIPCLLRDLDASCDLCDHVGRVLVTVTPPPGAPATLQQLVGCVGVVGPQGVLVAEGRVGLVYEWLDQAMCACEALQDVGYEVSPLRRVPADHCRRGRPTYDPSVVLIGHIVVLPVARKHAQLVADWSSVPGCVGVLADHAGIHLHDSVVYLVFPWDAVNHARAAKAMLAGRGATLNDARDFASSLMARDLDTSCDLCDHVGRVLVEVTPPAGTHAVLQQLVGCVGVVGPRDVLVVEGHVGLVYEWLDQAMCACEALQDMGCEVSSLRRVPGEHCHRCQPPCRVGTHGSPGP